MRAYEFISEQHIDEIDWKQTAAAGLMGASLMGSPEPAMSQQDNQPPAVQQVVQQEQDIYNKQVQLETLKKVAKITHIKFNPSKPLPKVMKTSTVSDDKIKEHYAGCLRCVASKSGLSVYSYRYNEIWLANNAKKDTLAHEYVHYLQYYYEGYTHKDFTSSSDAEFLEDAAVDVQNEFR